MEKSGGDRPKAAGGREGSIPVCGKNPWIASARLMVKNLIEDTPAVGDKIVWAEQKEILAAESEQRWRLVNKRDMQTQSQVVEPSTPVHLQVHLHDNDKES